MKQLILTIAVLMAFFTGCFERADFELVIESETDPSADMVLIPAGEVTIA